MHSFCKSLMHSACVYTFKMVLHQPYYIHKDKMRILNFHNNCRLSLNWYPWIFGFSFRFEIFRNDLLKPCYNSGYFLCVRCFVPIILLFYVWLFDIEINHIANCRTFFVPSLAFHFLGRSSASNIWYNNKAIHGSFNAMSKTTDGVHNNP